MTIRAIETQYKGYRFRSRLEARWAVFFDALGIQWEYETEGFDLGEAGWYLPDFWLPELDMYIEIKGVIPTEEEIGKCEAVRSGLGAIVLFAGLPQEHYGYAWAYDLSDSSGGALNADDALWGVSEKGHVCVMAAGERDREFYSDPCMETLVRGLSRHWPSILPLGYPHLWQRIHKAAQATRSARFEHGEAP